MRFPVNSLILMSIAILFFGCKGKDKGHEASVPSIDCEVVSGPNKGKKGKRTEDGWCEGDWGGTECKPRSKCKDVSSDNPNVSTPDDEIPEGDQVLAQGGTAVVGIIPPNGSSPVEYCIREGNILSILFRNTGDLASPDRTTNVKVEFSTDASNSAETKLMPSIPPGGTIEMTFEIPGTCFSPDCHFSVQWSNQPVVLGRCIG